MQCGCDYSDTTNDVHICATHKRVAELELLIKDCQNVLTLHLPPGGPSAKFTISRLLEILDGERARSLIPNYS